MIDDGMQDRYLERLRRRDERIAELEELLEAYSATRYPTLAQQVESRDARIAELEAEREVLRKALERCADPRMMAHGLNRIAEVALAYKGGEETTEASS